MFSFDLSFLNADTLPILAEGMYVTLKITVTAILLGMVLGTGLAILRISNYAPLRFLSALYVNFFRSIPLVMVLLWFSLLVPFIAKSILIWTKSSSIVVIPDVVQFLVSIFFDASATSSSQLKVAIVAFTLFEAAYYSEIIRAGMSSVTKDQGKAALALGMTKYQSIFHVILPQAFRVMLPLLMTQGIVLFQDTALVYVLGVADFFGQANNIGNSYSAINEMLIFVGAVYFVICFSVSLFVTKLKKRIV